MAEDPRDFDEALRQWAARPPATAPSRAAAEVVTRIRLDRRRRRRSFSWLAAAAAVMLMVSTVVWRQHGALPEGSGDRPSGAVVTGMDQGVVLMWLDEETPLYMTYQMADAARDKEGLEP